MIQSVLTTKLAHSINAGILAKMPIPVEKVLNVKQRATVLFANVPMDGEDILLQNVSNMSAKRMLIAPWTRHVLQKNV